MNQLTDCQCLSVYGQAKLFEQAAEKQPNSAVGLSLPDKDSHVSGEKQ
jgi:hypothetical protein